MAGYTRQTTFVDDTAIEAADHNNELDQVEAAFSNTTGHSHDGTAAEGPVIGVIGDAGVATPLNKILIDTSNDNIGFWIDVSSSSVEQLVITDGTFEPVTDSDVALGTTSKRFSTAYVDAIDATNYSVDLVFTQANPEILGGDTDGALYISADTAANQGGNVTLFGNTHATRAGDIEFRDDTSVVLDYDKSATEWTVSGNVVANDGLSSTGTVTFSGGGSLTGTWSDLGTVTTIDINGGTADNVLIGGTTPAAGNFTTLDASTSLVLASGATVTAILDEDNMATDSATALATQQSIKAYVDANANGSLSTVLGVGNSTGGTNIVVTAGDSITVDTLSETTAGNGIDVDGLNVKDGGFTAAGTSTFAGQTISDLGTVTTADVNGGTIDGTAIGGSSASTGQFTTVQASSTITATGNVVANSNVDLSGGTGNVVLASGQGIDFSATSDGSGTSSSELFDDYEEGTFTPFIADSTVSDSKGQTHSTQTGIYTKVGNMVYFQVHLVWTGIGTLSTSQQAQIGGLPYAPADSISGVSISETAGIDMDTAYSWIARVDTDSAISFQAWGDNTGSEGSTQSNDVKINNSNYPNFTAAGTIKLSGFYKV